jgi:hypothetical protein
MEDKYIILKMFLTSYFKSYTSSQCVQIVDRLAYYLSCTTDHLTSMEIVPFVVSSCALSNNIYFNEQFVPMTMIH